MDHIHYILKMRVKPLAKNTILDICLFLEMVIMLH